MAAPWVILGRVPRVAAAYEEPEDGADAAAAFSLAVALPPGVTVLAAARSAHLDPARPDKYPYSPAVGVPGGVVALYGKLYWLDLSWGVLSCDPFLAVPELLFISLPRDRELAADGADDIHSRCCVTVSGTTLCYAEIVEQDSDMAESATISLWNLKNNCWERLCSQSFVEIWNDKSYSKTWLPKQIPELVTICSSHPNLVYFALEQHLFSVDIFAHKVVEFAEEPHLLVNLAWPSTASSRYIISWGLAPSTVIIYNALTKMLIKKEKDNIDKETYLYARYCCKRAEVLKRGFDLCHMCFFEKGCFTPVKKIRMEKHCDKKSQNQRVPMRENRLLRASSNPKRDGFTPLLLPRAKIKRLVVPVPGGARAGVSCRDWAKKLEQLKHNKKNC